MPNLTGKRYVCQACGSEMLVTRGGDGALACCGKPMLLQGPPGGQPPRPKEEAERAEPDW